MQERTPFVALVGEDDAHIVVGGLIDVEHTDKSDCFYRKVNEK